jgi:hypothetical protein
MLLARLLFLALVALAVFGPSAERDRQPLLVDADYPVCVTVRPPPLEPRPSTKNLYPRRKDIA